MPPEKNRLYYGDNLQVLREYIPDDSVDLIYLDPPFNSRQDYNVLFAERDGSRSASQITAFKDTWEWNLEAERSYEEVVERGGRVSDAIRAFRTLLGHSDMMAYLAMMAPRLLELRRVLKDTGSIYLHCDPTASHYLKLLLDSVFGPENFLNEIIWRRTGSHNSAKRFGPIHDTLLFYARERAKTFFKKTHRPYTKGHVDSYFKAEDATGRYWTNALTGAGRRGGASGAQWRGYDPDSRGRHWAIPSVLIEDLQLPDEATSQDKLDALDAAGYVVFPSDPGSMPTYRQYLQTSPGLATQDVWCYQPHTRGVLAGTDEGIDEDVRWMVLQGDKQRMGYQTQKPEGLLERVLNASSKEGSVVLDPFCGCGTTIQVAQKLNRRWIGIDITHLAIGLIKTRLDDSFGPDVRTTYEVIGEPTDVAGAEQLALENKYQFQYWALGLCGGRPTEGIKKGADRGIDGRLFFHEATGGESKQIIFSVKGGRNIGVAEVRDLIGVLTREKASIGVYISFEEPTGPMKREAAEAGFYTSADGSKYPRVQLLTIKGLLEGTQRLERPLHVRDVTFRKAPRARADAARNLSLNLGGDE